MEPDEASEMIKKALEELDRFYFESLDRTDEEMITEIQFGGLVPVEFR